MANTWLGQLWKLPEWDCCISGKWACVLFSARHTFYSTVQLLDSIFVNLSGLMVCKVLFYSHNSLRNGILYQPQRESFWRQHPVPTSKIAKGRENFSGIAHCLQSLGFRVLCRIVSVLGDILRNMFLHYECSSRAGNLPSYTKFCIQSSEYWKMFFISPP